LFGLPFTTQGGFLLSMNRCLLLLALLVVFLPARAAQTTDKEKLVGTWRYQDKEQVATYVFHPDGTFHAELRQGEKVRKFEGLWKIRDDLITYTYKKDSYGRANSVVESDRLLRVDESSYTIEAGDRNQRTYWRVK
jgi:uncharacterized protein (TIGR03066 family)